MRAHCIVAVYERPLGGCISELIVWWLYMRDHCIVAVYE